MLEWDHRYAYALEVMLPWVARSASIAGRIVEFGCGDARVTAAVAATADSVLGLDIDAGAVQRGREKLAEKGLSNADLVSGDFEELIGAVEARRGEVDLFLFFAVLEHLTTEERLEVLATARDVLAAGGAIAVVESPNRLLYWDYHTSQLPFFGMLPDDLALRYSSKSPREEFATGLKDGLPSSEAGVPPLEHAGAAERLARWGRGLSFHEFELVFDDFPDNVVGCNYEPELFAARELHPEELYLARFLRRTLPQIPPSFSRYYIDFVMAFDGRPSRYIEPWSFETTNSRNVDLTEWDTLLMHGGTSRLIPHFPNPTDEVVLGFANTAEPIDVLVHAWGTEPIYLRCDAGPGPNYLRAKLEGDHESVTIDVTAPCQVTFVGFASHRACGGRGGYSPALESARCVTPDR